MVLLPVPVAVTKCFLFSSDSKPLKKIALPWLQSEYC